MQPGKDAFSGGPYHALLPQLESLESRAMLVSPFEGTTDVDIFFNFPADVSTDYGSSVVIEETSDPLPVIPFDHSVSPFKDCPGLPPELCLPGDLDGSGSVDFSDFLILSTNFGLEDATWQDGDLSGDGLVTLADFLLLSSNFGKTA